MPLNWIYVFNKKLHGQCSFIICTLMCAGAAVIGYLMFGESTESQFTLNMPSNLVASKVAIWTTVRDLNSLPFFFITL